MTHWYYADAQGQRQGPFSAEELAGHVRAERLAAHSLVWRDGLETWQPLASMASELDVALHQTALDLRGADSELTDGWTEGLLFALGGPIYAGTNEIQRNIIAERLLGLPRESKG